VTNQCKYKAESSWHNRIRLQMVHFVWQLDAIKSKIFDKYYYASLYSVISGWYFSNATTCTIAIDFRYTLLQIKVVNKADNL